MTASGTEDRRKRPAVGRGLAALFGDAGGRLMAEPGAPRSVPIETIRPSPFQPRRRFAEAELDGLAQSIREKGIVQPLLVRPIEDAVGDSATDFELVAGERRWRAAQRAGVDRVRVIVGRLGDLEALEVALVENLQREDLSALEEAEAYSRLMREFGRSQADLAEAFGKSRSHVANTVRLLSLPMPVRQQLDQGELTAGHARALLAAPDPPALAGEAVRRGLNVRATEALVRRRLPTPPPPRPARAAATLALERDLAAALALPATPPPTPRGAAL